ncbi:hypothetical protein GW916_05770 [bacterium]|nr:hypothetical protein [bacterium]
MNLRIFTLATVFTSSLATSASEWKVDFSRRFQPEQKVEMVVPPETKVPPKTSLVEVPTQFVKNVFLENDPAPEVVILNTNKGFIPSSVSLRVGQAYRFFIVNVNPEQKNVSFVMEHFKQHHATYYGEIKSFVVKSDEEGIFRFSSPETAALGKMIVSPARTESEPELRFPASE